MENLGFLLDAVVARLRKLGARPAVLEEPEAIMTRRHKRSTMPTASSWSALHKISHRTC
jgi:hypothetical protein